MSRLFISHSSANNAVAIALCRWLAEEGYSDVFLDLDPKRGLIAGDKWQEALRAAAGRCEGVIFLLSPAWVNSKWCLGEFILAKLLAKRIFGVIVEPIARDQVPPEMAGEWQLCELVGDGPGRAFDVPIGTAIQHVTLLESGLGRLGRGLERAGIDARNFPWPPPDDPNRAPYRGLRALEAEDAAIFFGRDPQIVRALDTIRTRAASGNGGLFAILGASGSGKSSFLRAGLWPRLARDDVSFLTLPVIRPETAAISGGAGLAVALSTAFAQLGRPLSPGRIKERLASGPDGFARILDELVAHARDRLVHLDERSSEPTVILSLDQAEELFNAEGRAEADAFLSVIAPFLTTPLGGAPRRIIVLATIRSDRYALLQSEPRLANVSRDLFDLLPISPSEFKGIIEGPARLMTDAGGKLAIDGALTERLITDAQGADALPLLGFILERLFADYSVGGRIALGDYEAIGGLQGSLQAAIARALADPSRSPSIPVDEAARMLALRAAFIPWLARINIETGATMRRVARLSEIPQESRAIIERLVSARLLIADRRTDVDIVEIAHESLLRQWPMLAAWLGAAAADLQLIDGVERSMAEWVRNGRHEVWLDHRLERLADARALVLRPDFRDRLGSDGLAYLEACAAREARDHEQKEDTLKREATRLGEIAAAQKRTARLQRHGRWTLIALALILVLGLTLLSQQRTELVHQRLAVEGGRANLFAELARVERLRGNWDAALRLAVMGARLGQDPAQSERTAAITRVELATTIARSGWDVSYGRHEGWVTMAGFSADGRRVLSASLDKTARVWSAASGTDILVLRGHADAVRFAAYDQQGSKIVTASSDKTARIWDAATGRQLAVLQGHRADVMSAVFSPDGRHVLTGSFDHEARIWDVTTGQTTIVMKGHGDWLFSALYSPDGTRIVTASQDKTARIWDAATGRQLIVLQGHDGPIYLASFSPDGQEIVTASSDGTARLWDAATGRQRLVLRGHQDYLNSALFSPDGRTIVTSSGDKTARLWDARGGQEIAVFRGHADYLNYAAFSPDGSRIVTAAKDGTARVWRVAAPDRQAVFRGHTGDVTFVAANADGSRLVTSSTDKTARLWDTATHETLAILKGHEGPLRSAAFSPDGSRIVTASQDRTARLWNVATGRQVGILTGHDNWVLSAAFSPDGSKIVTSSWDKTVRLWDATTGQAISVLQGHEGPVWSAAFSPDGTRIVSASWDMTARIWDTASGAQLRAIPSHHSRLWRAAFSPDGARVAAAGDDGLTQVWDVATGTETALMRGHEGPVLSVAFRADGARLVTASADGSARIWDSGNGQEIAELLGHTGEVLSARYVGDGRSIVTASRDGTARLWDARLSIVPTAQLIDDACVRKLGNVSNLSLDELKLAGYAESGPSIDVCAKTFGGADKAGESTGQQTAASASDRGPPASRAP